MNKKSLLLALITGTAPLIAQDKPSQVLESLMQPLPSVATNIQARQAAYPALRHIPSSACAFVTMADVQGNIIKLFNSEFMKAVSEGESVESAASIHPIESIAIAFDQDAVANFAALLKLANNSSALSAKESILSNWHSSSKEEYQASFESILQALDDSGMEDIFKGVNFADINLPEIRLVATMKPDSDALMAKLKQQFDEQLDDMSMPMPIIEQDGYTIISLPLAMGVSMIPNLPEGSMDAIVKNQHYLAVKFEGNCISVVYNRDLKKISVTSMGQSMLNSDKLKLSDARLEQGIIGSSFINAALINMVLSLELETPYGLMLENVFQSLAKKHIAISPALNAAALATAKISKQISDLRKNFSKQIKIGDYSNVLWSDGNLSYTEAFEYAQSAWNFKASKVNAWNKIDQAETISYLSMGPINTESILGLDFKGKELIKNAQLISQGVRQTLGDDARRELNDLTEKFIKNQEKIAITTQAISNIYTGTEGSITLYADNKLDVAQIDSPEPRVTIFSAVSDKKKVLAGMHTLQELCKKKCKLEGKYIISDKFLSISNSAALNHSIQSELSQSSSIKQFAGAIFYFNGQAALPYISDKSEKEAYKHMPKVHAIIHPNDGKLIFRALLK